MCVDSFTDMDAFVLGVSVCDVGHPCSVINAIPVHTAESALVVAFDTLVVVLTFYKTYRMTRLARSAGIRSGLSEVVLRDGE